MQGQTLRPEWMADVRRLLQQCGAVQNRSLEVQQQAHALTLHLRALLLKARPLPPSDLGMSFRRFGHY